MPKEDEPRGIIAPLKENLGLVLLALSPGSIMKQINKMKAMSPPELLIYILTTSFWITCLFGSCFLSILGFFLTLMRGSFGQGEKSGKEMELVNSKKSKDLLFTHLSTDILSLQAASPRASPRRQEERQRRMTARGRSPWPTLWRWAARLGSRRGASPSSFPLRISLFRPRRAQIRKIYLMILHHIYMHSFRQATDKEKAEVAAQQEAAMKIAEKKSKAKPEASPLAQIDVGSYCKKIIGFLTRNFFNMKNVALVIAFLINIMLLFYRASPINADSDEDEDGEEADETDADGGEEEDDDIEEWIHVEPDYIYVEHVISVLAVIHALLSFCMVIAYYNLKVPLGIFIREKEVGRRLEFEGLYIKEKPEDDDMKAHWDSIVISSKSFPNLYWDKFIKKRVRQKYAEEFDFDIDIDNLYFQQRIKHFKVKDWENYDFADKFYFLTKSRLNVN